MAQEDHAQRAVLTALGLHQRLAQRFDAFAAHKHASTAVRMGLHTGLVTVSGVGHDQVDASVIIGDTAAMARALQGRAAAGTILCTAVSERPLTYLTGRCFSYAHATPYLPIIHLVKHACRILGTDAAETITAKVQQYLRQLHMDSDEWLPYLLQLLGVPADAERHTALTPQVMRARTFASLLQMSLNVSRQQPLVIEIEDLHWIDATSEA